MILSDKDRRLEEEHQKKDIRYKNDNCVRSPWHDTIHADVLT